MTAETPLGSSALLRMASLPIRYWLYGANPKLFNKIKLLEIYEEQHRARASQLAEQIGQQLVPHPALSRDDRALILAVRRNLHRGNPVGDSKRERMLEIITRLSDIDHGLIRDLVSIANQEHELVTSLTEVSGELLYEQDRLWRLPMEIVSDSPVAKAFLSPIDLDGAGHGAQQNVKQRRRRFEYAWHRITRASTNSTPRDWFSQVALLRVDTASPPRQPIVTSTFSAKWTENVRSRRRALLKPSIGWPEPDSLLAVNPLHWDEDEYLVTVILDQHDEPTQLLVRHTPLLDAICTALDAGARTFGELAEALDQVAQDKGRPSMGLSGTSWLLGSCNPVLPPVSASKKRRHRVTPLHT